MEIYINVHKLFKPVIIVVPFSYNTRNNAYGTEKIDGAVAMIMALDRAIRCGCVSDESVYDLREMLIL